MPIGSNELIGFFIRYFVRIIYILFNTNETHFCINHLILCLICAIKKKIQEQNWTWDQVLAWRNGEEEAFFKDHQERSVLEKKIDQLLESQAQMREHQKQQEQFNLALIKRLEEVSQHKHQLEIYIEEKLQNRDQLLLESLRKTQEDKKKRKGIFRFFG